MAATAPKPKALDNYELSDHESESEESDASPKKRIPDWARGTNLTAAMKQQFTGGVDGGLGIDPDELFADIATCDLETIFAEPDGKGSKARYRKRYSSGNWIKDRLTHRERLEYRQAVGLPTGGEKGSTF